MHIGSDAKHGVRIGEYGPDYANENDGNGLIGWAEPACEHPKWILWFTKKGDAIFYGNREPGGAVIGEPIRVNAR